MCREISTTFVSKNPWHARSFWCIELQLKREETNLLSIFFHQRAHASPLPYVCWSAQVIKWYWMRESCHWRDCQRYEGNQINAGFVCKDNKRRIYSKTQRVVCVWRIFNCSLTKVWEKIHNLGFLEFWDFRMWLHLVEPSHAIYRTQKDFRVGYLNRFSAFLWFYLFLHSPYSLCIFRITG